MSAAVHRANRIAKQNMWHRIQKEINEDGHLQTLFRQMNKRVIVIDRLNQIPQLQLSHFQNKVATNVERSDEYILSTSLHSIGCHRKACQGSIGIQKIRYSDPLEYRRLNINKKTIFVYLANQAPHASFIEVDRDRKHFRKKKKDMLYTVSDMLPNAKHIKITGNMTYSKEVDDMLTVALFLKLKQMGKETYIQSCDKYRWMGGSGMGGAGLSAKQKRQVKENQLMPYFLSKEMMSEPAMLLMGYECSYDCREDQRNPHDETCMLKTPFEKPDYQ
uniref:Uncharacterized protein n=1 Tax=Pithovirus LCPAC304 TaxID=2506594 RepID=A0A481Z7Y0_9VIRU|nr:MAG: hypothetical protein LCPAC304_00420 [Pithovirus LCPAC304]